MLIISRKTHTELNRLILTRLPHALPPHSLKPDVYATGLSQFAPVYATFELLWKDLLERHSGVATDPRCDSLRKLYIPELLRTERLKHDLTTLLQVPSTMMDVRMCEPNGLVLRAFLEHMKLEVSCRPHVLIAYAWVMYMALFNGGRWIRAQLLAAGDAFWNFNPNSLQVFGAEADLKAETLLRFFHFGGSHDGEDIKNDFKHRLTEVERLLTPEQRQDIVLEAQQIFEHLILLVRDLDDIIATRQSLAKDCISPLSALSVRHMLPTGLTDLIAALRQRLHLTTSSAVLAFDPTKKDDWS